MVKKEEKRPLKKRFSTASLKAVPCHACYSPCEEGQHYCPECIESGDSTWHADMIARWQKKVEEKEAS
jgi:hypothetical protein